MRIILTTERLVLREFLVSDHSFIIALLNSPGWLKYIADRNIKTKAQAMAYLENVLIKSYADNGFGAYLVMLKDGTPVGLCGIIKRTQLVYPDIGFAFLPGFTGKGLALEVARATLSYAQETLKLPVVMAITVPGNDRSRKLLEKIGLAYKKTITFPNDAEELMLYSTVAGA